MYRSGLIQQTVDRLLAISMKFDDNGEIDMWSFDDKFDRLETANASDYGNYVARKILNRNNLSKWGSTCYYPVMKDILKFYFGPKPKSLLAKLFGSHEPLQPYVSTPAMVLFITDGANDDPLPTENLLKESMGHNIYWQMIGVGNENEFSFLQRVAQLYPHVGFVSLASLDISDEDIYEKLVSEEFCSWVKKI